MEVGALGHQPSDTQEHQSHRQPPRKEKKPKALLILDGVKTEPLPLGSVPTPLGTNSALREVGTCLWLLCRGRGFTQGHPNLPSTQVGGKAAAAAGDALWVLGPGELGFQHSELPLGAL